MPETTPRLAQIRIFPIKSLPGVACDSVEVLASGALRQDRRWAICDATGRVVNAKRTAAIHRLQAAFSPSLDALGIRVGKDGPEATFHLHSEREAFEAWLSKFFGFAVQVVENAEAGFPDDTDSPGPTVVSTATLTAVTEWFPGVTLEEARRRFRANLEIDGVEPFWEDRLFAGPDESVRFQIGEVAFEGINPCARCAVPTRQPESGEPIYQFARIFGQRREKSLPAWAHPERFDHFYRLAVNTRVPATNGDRWLRVGDAVRVLDAMEK